MKWIFFIIFSLSLSVFADVQDIEGAIVKISVESKIYNYERPWEYPKTYTGGGSGFIVKGENGELCIMTNAHVVKNAQSILVFSGSSDRSYTAEVMTVDHDCDLAVLKTKNSSFFAGKPSLSFADTFIDCGEDVTVYGFPMGGSGLCMTSGQVSRTETRTYAHSGRDFLISQIDAAINPGNSGGPVISKEGTVVGVVHQGFSEGQNIGYMIPIPVIQHFMEDLKHSPYLGFPLNFLGLQPILDPTMHTYYGLTQKQTGILVTKVPEDYFFSDCLQSEDVILEVDGYPVSARGNVYVENLKMSIPVSDVLSTKHFGDSIRLKVMRERGVLEVESILEPKLRCRPAIYQNYDKSPTYCIFSGLVFQPLVIEVISKKIQNFYENGGSFNIISTLNMLSEEVTKFGEEGKEIIFLANILNPCAQNYPLMKDAIVKLVNGKPVFNMRDFVELVEESFDPLVKIEFLSGEQIVFDRQDHQNQRILNSYSISSDRSRNLQQLGLWSMLGWK